LKPILYGVIKCLVGFEVTLKCLTLNDLDVPFLVKSVFRHRFD